MHASVYVSAQVPKESRKGHQIPWDWSSTGNCELPICLRTELRSSVKAFCALDPYTVSQASWL